MRTRRMAGIAAASAVALAAAVSVAQLADRGPSAVITPSKAGEDPIDAVEAFVRRNRKEADDSIQSLSREAEALRARLARVETALARWQAVAGSLNPGQKWTQPDEPTELTPIEGAPAPISGPTRPGKAAPTPFDPPGTDVPPRDPTPEPPSRPTEAIPEIPPPRD